MADSGAVEGAGEDVVEKIYIWQPCILFFLGLVQYNVIFYFQQRWLLKLLIY